MLERLLRGVNADADALAGALADVERLLPKIEEELVLSIELEGLESDRKALEMVRELRAALAPDGGTGGPG